MVKNLIDLDADGTYSYADYLSWQFDEIVELIKGHIYPMATPMRKHQEVSGNLHFILRSFFNNPQNSCKVYAAPFDVRFVKNSFGKTDKEIYTVVQPDLCVICDENKLDERGCIGTPDLIIEILSKGTEKKDKITKKMLYQEFGVPEFWIVYPNEKFIEVFFLENEKYGEAEIYSMDEQIISRLFPTLSIDINKIFES